jgi:hypothetical protein
VEALVEALVVDSLEADLAALAEAAGKTYKKSLFSDFFLLTH